MRIAFDERNLDLVRKGYATEYLLAQAEWRWSKPAPGPMADKIRKALDKPITITAKDEPLGHVLDTLRNAAGLTIQFKPDPANAVDILSTPVTTKLDNVSLGAALQWLEDVLPGYQVAVRDYGLLLAKKDSLPPRALLLNDFWKGSDKPKADDGKK